VILPVYAETGILVRQIALEKGADFEYYIYMKVKTSSILTVF